MQSIFFLKNFVYNSNLTVHAISFTLQKEKVLISSKLIDKLGGAFH